MQFAPPQILFGGSTSVEVDGSEEFDMTRRDYSITARIRTQTGGTLFSKAAKTGEWVADGKNAVCARRKVVLRHRLGRCCQIKQFRERRPMA